MVLGVVPVAAASLATVQRLWQLTRRGSAFCSGGNLALGLVGLALLALPQLLLEGFLVETLWIALGAASLVFGIGLASFVPKTPTGGLAGAATLTTAALALAAPAVWRLISAEPVMLWWVKHTNVWAAMAAMVAAATVPLYGKKLREYALVLLTVAAVLVAAATGSRTAIFAVVAGAAATFLVSAVGERAGWRVGLVTALGATAAVAVVLASPLGSRLAGLVADTATSNQVIASEELQGEYWTKRGVEVVVAPGPDGLRQFLIRSSDGKALGRAHQRFVLPAGAVRTLVFEFTQTGAGGGVVAFSEPTGSMIVPFGKPGEVAASGQPEVLAVEEVPTDGNWTLALLTVRNTGEQPVVWRVGISPNLRGGGVSELKVRHVRMFSGTQDLGYQPTYAATRLRELATLSASQRLSYADGALGLLVEKPLFGHGSGKPFYQLLDDYALSAAAAASDRPTHAHSLVGDVLVRFGIVGLVGLLALLTAAVRTLPRGGRLAALPFLVVVFVLGLGDATFFNAGGPFVLGYLLLAYPDERMLA